MDYLFLHRDKRTFTSERQKNLLFKTAHLYWEQKFANQGVEKVRRVDCEIYKYVLYYLEVRQVFLDPKLSLKKLSEMIETNQTYLSNVINRYFGCHLKDLVNTYRVEYAKELLRSGKCPLEEFLNVADSCREVPFMPHSVSWQAYLPNVIFCMRRESTSLITNRLCITNFSF